MAKSGQGKKNNSKTNPPTPQPKIIEIDETICYRPSQTPRNQLISSFQKASQNPADFLKLLSKDDFITPELIDLLLADTEEETPNLEEVEARVKKILGPKAIKVNTKNLEKYINYLEKNLQQPSYLSSREEFFWEEEYVYGGGNKKEYEKLKKTRPSYTDTFQLLRFNTLMDDQGSGILADVQRLSDKKQFTLPLCDLGATEENSPNYQLLEDYSLWFFNYH